jgi:hypothetical protein
MVRTISRFGFDWPTGMTLDGRGWLYIGDTDNHCIKRIWVGQAAVPPPRGNYKIYQLDDGSFKTVSFDNLNDAG